MKFHPALTAILVWSFLIGALVLADYVGAFMGQTFGG